MNLGEMISETVVCYATEMDPKEVKLIGFMGGYVARSYCTMQKPECEHCQRLLILDGDTRFGSEWNFGGHWRVYSNDF